MMMKSLVLISASILSLCIPAHNALALDCVPQELTQDIFDKIDFIAKGQVTDYNLDVPNNYGMAKIPFTLHIEKAWKGANAGEDISMIYMQGGGDGFPYTGDQTYIIYANHEGDYYATSGCMGGYNLPMSDELKEFTQNPPYVNEKDPAIIKHNQEMQTRLETLEEDTLDAFANHGDAQ